MTTANLIMVTLSTCALCAYVLWRREREAHLREREAHLRTQQMLAVTAKLVDELNKGDGFHSALLARMLDELERSVKAEGGRLNREPDRDTPTPRAVVHWAEDAFGDDVTTTTAAPPPEAATDRTPTADAIENAAPSEEKSDG